MTLLRSRTPTADATLIASPSVAKALSDWDARVSAAQEEGRRQGLAEAEARIKAAEDRAAQAEQAAEQRQQKRQEEHLARFAPVLAALSGAARKLDPLEKQLLMESEAQCVRLALAVAAAVLRREPAHDPAWMDAVVKRALAEIPDRRAITIRMHPQDAASLQERIRVLASDVPGLETLVVQADDTLSRGACILQSRGSRLDASLAGCWDRLALRLLDAAPSSDVSVAVWPGDSQPAAGDDK